MSALSKIRGQSRREPSQLLYYTILILLALFAMGPLIVLVFNSLKTTVGIIDNPFGPPLDPILNNYSTAWEQGNMGTTMRNSAIITFGTVLGVWFIAGTAAYALARLDLPFGDGMLMYLFVSSTIPFQLFLVPLFFLWSNLNLTNTLIGVIIIYWALFSPFATLLLRSYLIALPRDFEEAARIDGASELQVMTRIVLPLAWPGFLTIGLIAGLGAWNEFLFAVTFVHREELMPVTTSFWAFQTEFSRDWGLTSAAAVIMMLPVVALFLLLQRRFVEGLTSGGLR